MDKEKNVILFGASSGGEAFILNISKDSLKKYNILAIADNDKKKQGSYLYGSPIISPSEIAQYQYDEIIITSGFFLEIKEQLLAEFKIDKDKIILAPKNMLNLKPFEDEDTLNLANEVLLYIVDILEEQNITYFIDHGTLLGIIRDGDLIPWDSDIDISVLEDDIDRAIESILNGIPHMPMNEELKWTSLIYYDNNSISNSIEISFNSNNNIGIKKFPISIKSISFENGLAIQRITYAPEYHFKAQQYVNYKGRRLAVPYDYEKYLTFHYGEWRKPKKDSDWMDINNHRQTNVSYKKKIVKKQDI